MPAFELPLPVAADAALEEPERSDHNPALATDDAGTWIVAWNSRDSMYGTIRYDEGILFARSTDHGFSFTAAQPLNPDAATDYSQSVWGDHAEI